MTWKTFVISALTLVLCESTASANPFQGTGFVCQEVSTPAVGGSRVVEANSPHLYTLDFRVVGVLSNPSHVAFRVKAENYHLRETLRLTVVKWYDKLPDPGSRNTSYSEWLDIEAGETGEIPVRYNEYVSHVLIENMGHVSRVGIGNTRNRQPVRYGLSAVSCKDPTISGGQVPITFKSSLYPCDSDKTLRVDRIGVHYSEPQSEAERAPVTYTVGFYDHAIAVRLRNYEAGYAYPSLKMSVHYVNFSDNTNRTEEFVVTARAHPVIRGSLSLEDNQFFTPKYGGAIRSFEVGLDPTRSQASYCATGCYIAAAAEIFICEGVPE